MEREDVKIKKSEDFAVKIIGLMKHLHKTREFMISKQIYRSGTSIGANIAESVYAESDMDMIHKLRIALKEASETKYWLNILYKSSTIDAELYNPLFADCMELIRILSKIIIKLQTGKNGMESVDYKKSDLL